VVSGEKKAKPVVNLVRLNGTMPISPQAYDAFGYPGLTKRELIAAMLTQGLMSSDAEGNLTKDACVKIGVEHADALLLELAR